MERTHTCPECNGSTRTPYRLDPSWKKVIAGYDEATDTLPCHNCGAQYMYGRSRGQVRLNREGQPCKHSYRSQTVGRCLTEYTCEHCGDSYQIDSGD